MAAMRKASVGNSEVGTIAALKDNISESYMASSAKAKEKNVCIQMNKQI